MKTRLVLAAAAALAFSATGALAQVSPGETLFKQRCGVCHSMQPAPGKMGPPLAGIVGRKAASVPGFAYSDALKKSNVTWTAAKLNEFLGGPAKVIPGTKMLVSVPNAEQRTQLVAYLASVKK
jgi:cytochrome c